MSRCIQVHFDYCSPFAHLAARLLPALAKRHDATLDWKPIDLLRLSNFSGGMPYSDKKRAYVFVDVTRSSEFHGIEIRVPSPFPVRSESALRLAWVAKQRGVFEPIHAALFQAAWCDQRDISSAAVLRECAAAGGADAAALIDAANAPETLALLERESAASDEQGVFGVPSMIVDGELFWGIDSLPALEWRLRKLAAPAC